MKTVKTKMIENFADFLSTLEYDVVCKSTLLNIKEMMEIRAYYNKIIISLQKYPVIKPKEVATRM